MLLLLEAIGSMYLPPVGANWFGRKKRSKNGLRRKLS
jgi:hypothetical protein